jgi:hypothetical protein
MLAVCEAHWAEAPGKGMNMKYFYYWSLTNKHFLYNYCSFMIQIAGVGISNPLSPNARFEVGTMTSSSVIGISEILQLKEIPEIAEVVN